MSIDDVQLVQKVINRLKNAYNMSSDAKLADFLGVDPSTISAWKRRGNLDWKLIWTKCTDLSADYIIYEEMPIFREEKGNKIYEPVGDIYEASNLKNINQVDFVEDLQKIINMNISSSLRAELVRNYIQLLKKEESKNEDNQTT